MSALEKIMDMDPDYKEIHHEELLTLIPHRYPMLMIDRLEDVYLGESAVGIKNVSVNEPFFQGHFPGKPIMPGVLIIEAMGQTAAALVAKTLGEEAIGKLVYFMSVEEAKFRRPVVPGDVLRLNVVKERRKGNAWRFSGKAWVGNVLTDQAIFTAMLS